MAIVIVLTGTSSSGKSSVAKLLQKQLGEEFLFFEVDNYMKMLGEKYNNFNLNNPEAFIPNNIIYAKKLDDGTFDTITGPVYQKLYKTIPLVLNNLVNNGFNIIVDSLINDKEEIILYKKILNKQVKFVYLQALPETLLAREKARNDRVPGSALNWLKKFNCQQETNLTIDVDNLSIQQIVEKIRFNKYINV